MTVVNLEDQPKLPETLEEIKSDMATEAFSVPDLSAFRPAPKKRGRKPKAPPAPLPPPVEAAKPRTKRRNNARGSATDRAFQSAIAKVELERAKTIDELSKIMEQWDVKQARLKALDWKISTLKGTTQTSSIAGMQLSPYGQSPQHQPAYPGMNYPPMPSAYPPQGQPTYIPPAMRQPAIPVDPRAMGGSEGIVDDGQNDQEDQFLTNTGVVGGVKGWV